MKKLISWKQFNNALNANFFADESSPILDSCDQDDAEVTIYNWTDGEGNNFETMISLQKTFERFAPAGDYTPEEMDNLEMIPVSDDWKATVFDKDDNKVVISFYKQFNPF